MYRICFTSLNNSSEISGKNFINLQIVRWRRKPRWEPKAKSKLAVPPQRKEQNPNELVQLKSLHNNYRTQINSLRSYMQEEIKNPINRSNTENQNPLQIGEHTLTFLDQDCLKYNNIWNKKISLERENRIMEERKTKIDFVNSRLELANIKEEENANYYSEVLQIQKKNSESYIPQADLQHRIEEALENFQDTSFSINLKGDINKN